MVNPEWLSISRLNDELILGTHTRLPASKRTYMQLRWFAAP